MKKRILVIDDEEILTRSFALLLEKKGYEVLTVKNGQDAEAIIDEEVIDLVISDIRMPGMNGIEVVKLIRSKHENIPVIFVTGYADQKLQEEAQKLNPTAYVHKPFDALELTEIVKSSLGS